MSKTKIVIAIRWGNTALPELSAALAPMYDRSQTIAAPDPILRAVVSVMTTEHTAEEIRAVYAQHSPDPFVVFEKPETADMSGIVSNEQPRPEPTKAELQIELDQLLDLVQNNGIASLTTEQKARLTELSNQ